MHDILRERLIRKIESLPEQQVYQILDYIEFLESKHGTDAAEETSGLRRFAEAVEDKLRKKAMSPATLREAFQIISVADRVLQNVSSAGRKLMDELTPGGEDATEGDDSHQDESGESDGSPFGDELASGEKFDPQRPISDAGEPTEEESEG